MTSALTPAEIAEKAAAIAEAWARIGPVCLTHATDHDLFAVMTIDRHADRDGITVYDRADHPHPLLAIGKEGKVLSRYDDLKALVADGWRLD